MLCPFCNTENREDRGSCYVCDGDLGMLRVVANKARHHYNFALEHAERGRAAEAIEELHNALDLDARLVPAYTLLGTLLARQGNTEAAREAWEKALRINPQIGKTYDYLARLDTVREQLPMIERLGQACLALVIICAILIASLFYMGSSDVSNNLIIQAQQAFDNRHYGDALELLNQATAKRGVVHENTLVAADSLRRAISTSMDTSLKQIREFTFRDDFTKAIAAISELEKNTPDQATSKVLEMLRSDVHDQFRRSIQSLQKEYEAGTALYGELTKRITDFLTLYPEVSEKSALRQDLARARDMEITRRVAAIRATFDETANEDGSMEEAVSEVQMLVTEFPGADALNRERKTFIAYLLNFCYDRFKQEVNEQQYDNAQRHLTDLANFSSEFKDIVDYTNVIPALEDSLVQGVKDQQLLLIDQLITSKEFESADDRIREMLLASDLLTTTELAMVENYIVRLDVAECEANVQLVLGNENSYMEGGADANDALQLTKDYAYVISRLPLLTTDNKTRFLACAVAAATKAQNRTEAQRAYELYLNARPQTATTRALRKLNPNLTNPR